MPDSSKVELEVVVGDITVENVDAIVNAANTSLIPGAGVDRAIHDAAGPRLREACERLGGCETGRAKVAPGFDLAARWVILTVGPYWRGGTRDEPALLASCYAAVLACADEIGAASLAIPAISTGIYGYPSEEAAEIAVETLRSTPTSVSYVRFVGFDAATEAAYRRALGHDA